MEREIKFRAWDKKAKKIREVISICFGAYVQVRTDEPDIGTAEDLDWPDVILLQSTNLKDKNGKEIYEGDIVKEFYKGVHKSDCIVEWDECNPCFVLKRTLKTQRIDNDVEYDFIACDLRELEIIGNIYENKELLEDKNV